MIINFRRQARQNNVTWPVQTLQFAFSSLGTTGAPTIPQRVYADRVLVFTSTTGIGDITPGLAVTSAYIDFDDVGIPDNAPLSILITDVFTNGMPRDFELSNCTYHETGPTISRDTVMLSKINGVVGTSKIDLSGEAHVSIVVTARDMRVLTPSASAMIDAQVTLDDFAGVNTGTLTNSPLSGNPTKWVAINDNGTQRYIPTW